MASPCLTSATTCEVVEPLEHHHERATVTRNGRPVAVLISPDDLAELDETLDVLSDRMVLADIREADLAYGAGDVVPRHRRGAEPSPVSDDEDYELILTPPAVRAIRTGLPEAVAAAVVEFMTGPLISNPRRVGNENGGESGVAVGRWCLCTALGRASRVARRALFVQLGTNTHLGHPGRVGGICQIGVSPRCLQAWLDGPPA